MRPVLSVQRITCGAVGAALLLAASSQAVATTSAARGDPASTVLRTESSPWELGSRVRLAPRESRDHRWIVYVGSVTADTLHFRLSPELPRTQAVAWSSLVAAERSYGQHGHAGAGVLLGLLAGVGVGALVASNGEDTSGTVSGAVTSEIGKALTVVAGAGIGMALGAAVGSSIRSDEWEPIPLPSAAASTDTRAGAGGGD